MFEEISRSMDGRNGVRDILSIGSLKEQREKYTLTIQN